MSAGYERHGNGYDSHERTPQQQQHHHHYGGGIEGYDMSAGYDTRPPAVGRVDGYDTSAGYEIRQPAPAPARGGGNHGSPRSTGHEAVERTDLFQSESVVQLSLDEINSLATNHRSKSWLVVLYAPWCRFCQAMEHNFDTVARHLERSNVYVGRFRADGEYKDYAKRYLHLESFPTILFFPKNSSSIVKYQSENREVEALLGFVYAFE